MGGAKRSHTSYRVGEEEVGMVVVGVGGGGVRVRGQAESHADEFRG
jgi:hypothetical protein